MKTLEQQSIDRYLDSVEQTKKGGEMKSEQDTLNIFASVLNRVPKHKRKEVAKNLYPAIKKITDTLKESDKEWLSNTKSNFANMDEIEKLRRLFE